MGFSAGALALGAGIGGLIGGSPAQNVQLPQMFQMPNMGAAANQAYGGIGNLGQYNLYAPNIGTAQNITGGLVSNPYAPAYQQGANVAGQLGQLQALGQYGAGNALTQSALGTLNTAMDPQQALYNQQLQQTLAQQGAMNAAAGVGTTPYGASMTNQDIQNFNIAWQNNLLNRQLAGLSGAGTALGQGAYLSGQAPSQYLQGAAVPYATYSGIGQGQLGALSGLGQFGTQASGIPQQQIGDYLSYIGAGNQAGQVANQQAQVALNQANLAYNQNLGYGQMIGGGLASLGNQGFGMGGSGWGNVFGGGATGPASGLPSGLWAAF